MKKRIILITTLSLLILVATLFLFGCDKDLEGLAPAKSFSVTGHASYLTAPLTLAQLSSGIKLDPNWNYFLWTTQLNKSVSVTDALKSVSSTYYYIYSYNEQKYYFNPNQKYASYNSNSYYKIRLLSELKPNNKYGLLMSTTGVLKYIPPATPTPTKKIESSSINSSLGIELYNKSELTYFSIPLNSEYESITISKMFTQSGLASITYPQQIVSLSIKANYTLNSESSIARVILIDSNNNEYLAFEANPLMIEELDFNCDGQVLQNDIDELAQMWRSGTPIDINLVTEKGAHCKQLGVYLGELWKKGITEIPIDDITRIGRDINSLTVDNLCEETCNLNGIIPKSLRVELIDASIYLDSVKIQKKGATTNNLLLSQTQYNQEQEEIKIQDLNENLQEKGYRWVAGETSVSSLSYAEKKKTFNVSAGGTLPNTYGFEYYKGGIFEIPGQEVTTTTESSLPESWDWRNVHGENWMTRVKDQGLYGGCMFFSAVSTLEASINLYFNQHIDVDLSEQDFISCEEDSFYHNFLSQKGVVDENCFAYTGGPWIECQRCIDWQERKWKTGNPSESSFESIPSTDVSIKRALINYGPLQLYYMPWYHVMTLVGYASSNWKNVGICSTSTYFIEPQQCSNEYCVNIGEQTCDDFREAIYECDSSHKWQLKEYCNLGNKCYNKICTSTYPPVPNYEDLCDNGMFTNKIVMERDITNFGNTLLKCTPEEGDIYWIVKNSWGTSWGDEGYGLLYVPLDGTDVSLYRLNPPIYQPSINNYDIMCYDKDKDGYCSWGVSDVGLDYTWRQSNCPVSCLENSLKDCDDSNPTLGPFDENYNCINLVFHQYDFNCDHSVNMNDVTVISNLWRSGAVIDINLVTAKGSECKPLGVYLGNLWKLGITTIQIDEVTRLAKEIQAMQG